jgi:hypothetical protein
MKTFFGISIGIFCVLFLFWGVYNFSFKSNPNIPTVSESGTITKESSPFSLFKTSTNIEPIIQEKVLSAATDGRSLFFYSLDDQAFKKSTLDGKDKETLLSNLPGIPKRIVWSPSKEKALVQIKLPDNATLWHTVDLTLRTLLPLKPEMSRVAWDNTGSKILYQYTDQKTGERSLNIASIDGKDWRNITSLGTKDFFLPIPASVLKLWQRPGAREKDLQHRTSCRRSFEIAFRPTRCRFPLVTLGRSGAYEYHRPSIRRNQSFHSELYGWRTQNT